MISPISVRRAPHKACRPTLFGMAALVFILSRVAAAQSPATILTEPSAADTLQSPSDSLAIPDSLLKSETLDTTIVYSADKVNFTFSPRITILSGDARVNYRLMALKAGRIEIRWDEDLLIATGLTDTVQSLRRNSLGAAFDSVVVRGRPEMADGAQTIKGESLTYNIRTKQGRVVEGRTAYEDGWYEGGAIKKVDSETYNIKSGYYTTCDADQPHYSFWASEMKLRMRDKVVARPVVLLFDRVPVLIAPFGVFPARGGRHSGLLVPTYGESSSQGRYFTGLGYFWAPNDYYDARAELDYYERFGVLMRGDARYALRYVYTGGLSGTYLNQQRDSQALRRWDLQLAHNHQVTPNANLNVSAYFVSDKSYLKDISQNPNEKLKKTIRSDATYSQRWPGTPYSASVNLHHEEDLETGSVDQSLPQLFVSRSQSAIAPPPVGVKPEDARWWNAIYWRYSGSGLNKSNKSVTPLAGGGDLTVRKNRGGVKHDLGLTASQKPFGVFAFTPNINYSEVWVDEWFDYSLHDDGTADTVKHKEFRARRTFSAGAGLSTKLYGLFKPGLLGISAIRHTLAPSLSFTYTPDFSDGKWDYYEIGRDANGRERFYDRFAGNLYGGTPRQEAMALGIGIDNLFEYKRLVGGKESKGELFNLGLQTSHNFVADSLKWGDLSSSMRIKPLAGGVGSPLSGLGLDVSIRHSFYDQQDDGTGRYAVVNRAAPEGLRLLAFDLTTSFKVAGGDSRVAPKDTSRLSSEARSSSERMKSQVWTPGPLPWSVGVNLRYGETKSSPVRRDRNAWAGLNLELKATRNWKINSDMRVDLLNKKIVSTGISLYRDLHCWEGRFTWNPVGAFSGYYLIINVKSSKLKDVKVEKREGGGGFFGF